MAHGIQMIAVRAVLAPAAAVFLGVAQANAWGAIAYSMTTQDYGYSFDYGSRQAAEDRAMRECEAQSGADDCRANVFFNNGCGAVAWGTSPLGGGRNLYVFRGQAAGSRVHAENEALQECRTAFEPEIRNCRILVSVCD